MADPGISNKWYVAANAIWGWLDHADWEVRGGAVRGYILMLAQDLRKAQHDIDEVPERSEISYLAFLSCGTLGKPWFCDVRNNAELAQKLEELTGYFERYAEGQPVSAEERQRMLTFLEQVKVIGKARHEDGR